MQLLSALFILFTIVSLSLAGRREEYILRNGPDQVNNWEKDFAGTGNVGAASIDHGPTIITFMDPNNSTKGLGQFRLECLPNGYSQFNLSIPINLTVEVQQRLTIRNVYIWIGAQGTTPSTPYTNWGNSAIPSGGLTFVFRNLNGFIYEAQITLGDIISILTNPDGSFRSCFRVEVVVDVDRYCGMSQYDRAIRHSPDGCDFEYQAIYPATDSYFHVALNNDGSGVVNNDTLYFKGYCLDPTRSIYPNYNYQGELYSSYDFQVVGSPSGLFVEAPQNFPVINYLVNHEGEYLSRFLSGHQCTWQDVQNAIWTILFPNATTQNPSLLTMLKNSSQDCVQWIVDDSLANGRNFTPACPGGRYLMIIYPMVKNTCNCTKDQETQLVAFLTGGSCLNRCTPRVCHKVLRASGRICLCGNCAPLPSPSITSRPVLPSETTSPTISVTSTASYSVTSTASSSITSTPSSSYSATGSISVSSTASYSVTSTASYSVTSTASSSITSTPSSSYSSTGSISVSSTASPSVTSTPSISVTSAASISYSASNTARPSKSLSGTSCPSQSSTSAPSQSSTSAPSQSSTPCPSQSSTPAASQTSTSAPSQTSTASYSFSISSKPILPSDSSSPCPSRSARHSRSQTSTPCPSRSNSARPSKSQSGTPCPTRSRTISVSSKPIMPSVSSSHSQECHMSRSASASNSQPCHMTHSASPSNSMPCHMTHSASPSNSMCVHQQQSPSPSNTMCLDKDRPGKGHGGQGHGQGH